MSSPKMPLEPGDIEAAVQSRTNQLLRSNEKLREEAQRLLREKQELAKQLAEAVSGSQSEKAIRRAALNLLEDAEQARRVERQEVQARQQIEEELRASNRRKDEFLATLAHELRNPLAPIRNSLHLLRLAGTDSGAAERVREMLERQVNHMVRLVDDLLEVSRIQCGRIELRKEQIELAAVIRTAVETSKPLIEHAHHQLAISIPSEPLILMADPVRLAQVIANLLNNAAKYTRDGGQIWLTAKRDNSHVVVSVRDTGEGIPAKELSHVFELFTQVDRTLGRSQGGLGIGLSLVKTLVESHGGTVEVRSEGPGRGTEFLVRFPLASQQLLPATSLRPEKTRAVAYHRILVVDDNVDSADSLAALLKFLGADAETANDGEAALRLFASFRPSIAFLDIGMPGMDGYEVARRVRQRPEGRDVVLIALTGWGQDEDRRRSAEAGFNYHFVKPMEMSALQELIASLPYTRPQPIKAEREVT
ncbi:MAG: ATP-binding protein [Gemmataceae bacterium]